jgi:hypothetical protein
MKLPNSVNKKVSQLMRQYLHTAGQLCVVSDKEEKWLDSLKARGLAFQCSGGLLIRGVDDPIRKVKVKR